MTDGTIRMQLESGREVVDPSQEQVLEALRTMERNEESYVILERDSPSGDSYIQAAEDPAGGYLVEYQDGSLEQHVGLHAEAVQAVHDIFSWWVAETPGWRDGLPWQKVDL